MIRTMGIHRQHLFDLKVLVLLKFSTVLYFVTAEVVARSKAWLGRGFSCVCAQSRESDARPSFDLTPSQCGTIRLFMHNFTHQQHELPCKDDLRPVCYYGYAFMCCLI
ncbi:hypothetical protein ES332_D12G143000v1 [Gossypium tomentosum]|uniref:Uncharacterized protein n=1 Tax=Gossypium tomentosum TaxID=34277 RepID=A0A5D2I8H5_GOSTO|nr:hypothetical protein ES332_D12G143000v1 [Gossypium tomentosum]